MVLCYKIACLYFGNGDHRKCMEYLGRIIGTRDPQIRRDLQCYARILNLIASYEAGIDYNLDYQVRSVYLFLIKMNDMQQVQRAIMAFLKRLQLDVRDDAQGRTEAALPPAQAAPSIHPTSVGRSTISTFFRGSRASSRGYRWPR